MNKSVVLVVVVLLVGLGVFWVLNNDSEEESNSSTQEKSEESDVMEEEVVGYKDIASQEAYELVTDNPDFVIIDVSPNYAAGHLPGAINYYVGDGSLDEAIPTLDKAKSYLVYCHVDSASISGAQKLVDAGFEIVYRLEGNYQAWVDAGLPVEK